LELYYCQQPAPLQITGVARNFDGGGGVKTSCDVSLVTFCSDIITMTSLK